MQDIGELERRITAALDRIGGGLAGLERLRPAPEPDPPSDLPDAETLVAELAAEREVVAQLEERIRVLRGREEESGAATDKGAEQMRELVSALEGDRARLKKVNEALRNANQALREANAAGLADPHLVNTSVLTELEALRALRDSDRAELDQILGELAPALEDGSQNGEARDA